MQAANGLGRHARFQQGLFLIPELDLHASVVPGRERKRDREQCAEDREEHLPALFCIHKIERAGKHSAQAVAKQRQPDAGCQRQDLPVPFPARHHAPQPTWHCQEKERTEPPHLLFIRAQFPQDAAHSAA